MSIQAISFGATTKKGNHYKKTHAGTIAGTALGAGLSALTAYTIKTDKNLSQQLLKSMMKKVDELVKAGCQPAVAKKIILRGEKIGVSAAIILPLLIGLTVGAGINKIINRIKAHKADKAA